MFLSGVLHRADTTLSSGKTMP